MNTLHLSIITISVILTYTSAYAYNSTSTDYGNLSYLNQNQSTPKIISNGPIPTPLDIQKRMFDWCQAPRNDMGEIDPKISQFVLENNPKVLDNVHDADTKNRVINGQYWNILQTQLISNTTEFKSLGGNKSSIHFLSGFTLDSCPPITAINGTFMTHYNESYNFLLNYDANTFSYNFSKYTLSSYSEHVGSLSNLPVPEFPFAIPIFLASFVSTIVFYRMKFRK